MTTLKFSLELDAEIQDVAAKFKAANKTKRDQVKTLLA